MGRRPGRRRRREGRPRAARPARRRDHQTVRPRRRRPGRGSGGRLPLRRPRHATLNDRDVHYAGTMRFEADLDLADALDLDRALVHGAARRRPSAPPSPSTPAAPPRSVTSPAPRPPSTSTPRAPTAAHARTGCPPPVRWCSTPTSTRSTDGEQHGLRSHRPPRGTASGWCCSTRSRPGAATPAPRSPSSPSSTSTPSSPRPATTSPTGSANRSSSATGPACSLLHPAGTRLRRRPHRRVRPRRRRRRPTPTRPDRRPRTSPPVPVPPPPQDLHRLDLPHDRARRLRVDQPPRPPLPPRPHRHHAPIDPADDPPRP